MDRRGQGYVADLLVFALLISLASSLLLGAAPADPRIANERYACSLARSFLTSLQHATADGMGGLKYELDWLGLSQGRELRYKTLAELLVEDALLNMRASVMGLNLTPLKPSARMDEGVRELLARALDEVMGGRFGYRLSLRAAPIDLQPWIRLHFETSVEGSRDGRPREICHERVAVRLPISEGELTRGLENIGIQPQGLGPDLIAELTLELWSE